MDVYLFIIQVFFVSLEFQRFLIESNLVGVLLIRNYNYNLEILGFDVSYLEEKVIIEQDLIDFDYYKELGFVIILGIKNSYVRN